MVTISLIAALDRRNAIGRRDGSGEGNGMPWHLPDDFRRFKAVTLGKPLLMGHRTATAIGRALPGRPNLVLSRLHEAPFPGQSTVRTLDEALDTARDLGHDELTVGGGGEIYRLTLPYAQRLRLTLVDGEIAGADTLFPAIAARVWREVGREHHPADDRHACAFDWVDYVRAGPLR